MGREVRDCVSHEDQTGGEGGIRTHGGLKPTTVFEVVTPRIIQHHLMSSNLIQSRFVVPRITSNVA